MSILLKMVTDGKKEEHKLSKIEVAREYAFEKMAEANLYGSAFDAKIYREGPPLELMTVVTNSLAP
jgi:hypothetical protein